MIRNQAILIEKDKAHSTIWLNRPDKRNAMNDEMLNDLIEGLKTLGSDRQQRMIFLRGRGKVFSAGADLKMMRDLGTEENATRNRLPECLSVLYHTGIPVIGVGHGAVIGGANGILAACDIALALEDTVFAFSEVRIGLVPAVIAPYVMKRMGEYKAREFMLTGHKFTADEALHAGLINKVVPQGGLESNLEKIRDEILEAGPEAVRTCKLMISRIAGKWDFEMAKRETERLILMQSGSAEAQERIKSYLEGKERKSQT